MKIIFYDFEYSNSYFFCYYVACGVKFVNKASQVGIGAPAKDPSCPYTVPRDLFPAVNNTVSELVFPYPQFDIIRFINIVIIIARWF